MVKKIKRRIRRSSGTNQSWTVPFDSDGQAAVYIHKHGDTDDHSDCGPVVMCCERAGKTYQQLTPELHQSVAHYDHQSGGHICTWLDSGVNAMYFVLCDPSHDDAVYQFGLPADRARELLTGKVPHSAFHLPNHRVALNA
jgi:hypothetical protein